MLAIALAIVIASIIYSLVQKSYHIKPRIGFATAHVIGKTEDNETVQLTTILYEDESEGQHDEKLNRLYATREKRLKYQNERIQMIQKEIMEKAKAEKERIEAEGGTVSGVSSLDRAKSKRV